MRISPSKQREDGYKSQGIFHKELLLCPLCRCKPPGDLKLAAHHGGITAVDRQINVLEHHESIRFLHVVKKVNKGRPWAFGLNRGENRLMIRGCFACTNCWVLNQNIVFVGHLLQL